MNTTHAYFFKSRAYPGDQVRIVQIHYPLQNGMVVFVDFTSGLIVSS